MNEDRIINYLKNQCDKNEKVKIEEWINSNQSQFNKIKYIWEKAGYNAENEKLDFEKAWKRVNQENRISNKSKTSKYKIGIRNIQKIAAAIIFILAVGYVLKNKITDKQHAIVWLEKENLTNDNLKVELEDGTFIWLNNNSKIKYSQNFNNKTREIFLSGEAFFDVARNEKVPFIVYTRNSTTKVLGTSFNINSLDTNTVEIVVVTGKVSFAGPQNKVLINPGYKGVYTAASNNITIEKNSDLNFLAWKTREFVFEKASLEEVCKVLGKHFNTNIQLKDQDLNQKNLTASYSNKSLFEILDILELTFHISYNKTDSCINLYAK